jgi:hypothetical protein
MALLDDYRWLVGPVAADLLAELAGAGPASLKQTARLRKSLSAERVHLLLQQVTLRERARRKFAAADRMFFTPVGLEQATDEVVADYKAARFPARQPIADLCCGLGGDLLSLAGRACTLGIDRDPAAMQFAEANCQTRAEPGQAFSASVVCADVAQAPLVDVAAWHIDPDRRPGGRRTTHVDRYEPGLAVIERLLQQWPAAAIKLAPAAEAPPSWQAEGELEWISRGGECKQLVAWLGPLAAQPGWRRATILALAADRWTHRSVYGRPDAPVAVASRLGRYLAEPDPAVLAAHLVGALAEERALAAVAPGAVYLTGDEPLADAALSWFKITEVLPFDVRRLKKLLRARGIAHLEVKKRGVAIEPEQVRRQLRVPGDESATLFVTRLGAAVTAILAQRWRGLASPTGCSLWSQTGG